MDHREFRLKSPGGGDLFCQTWQPEEPGKAMLLLVHGLAEHSGRYGALARYFVSAGYTVSAMDLPGHGKSDGIRGHVNRYADFTDALEYFIDSIRAAEPSTPLFLMGHSMGGLIGATVLLSQQSRLTGCILSGPAVKAVEEPPAWQLLIARLLSWLLPKSGQMQLDASAVSKDPEVVRQYITDPLVYTGKISARLVVELFTAMEKLRARAHEIDLPILILHGGDDRLTAVEGSRWLHQRIGSADRTLIVYDGLYHEIFNEPERERVFDDMKRWLDARLAERDGGSHET